MSITDELAEISKLVKISKQGVPDVGHCFIRAKHDDVCLISFETKIKWFSITWFDSSMLHFYRLQVRQTENSGYCNKPFDSNGDILTEIDFIGFPKDKWCIFGTELNDDMIDITFWKPGKINNLNLGYNYVDTKRI